MSTGQKTSLRAGPVPGRAGLATRLLAGQTVVLAAGALTVGMVAAVVGPPIFHEHLLRAGLSVDASEMAHVELAYRDASLVAVGLGLLISLLAAGGVTWSLARLLRRPLAELTDAAQELARGRYDTRVPDVGSGTELDTLAGAFNVMAARLEGVEDTRRRLLSDLAHELRTPIATLTAYHEGLSDGVVPAGPEARAVLSEQTGRLARLADDIDEVSRAEEGRLGLDRRPVPVPDLLGPVAGSLREAYTRKGVALEVDASPGRDLVLDVDPVRLGQVLNNVLGNALRHTAPGGHVRVTARRDGAVAAVEIVDDGEGIPAHQLPHVFERFFRGDSARDRDRSGSGIGLTISRAIVDAHGGTLTASSDGLGTGTTFRLSLPLASPSNLHTT